ncbi:saccharopine dehydrogenase, variant 1 [Batrachochytrium dendrobatidis JEL423]|uniref:Saccharopine dehydrogenase [NADP(+), L-glutamate-forming] n=1 Tax=Batrachochytrium dendrobatidis (strain JEL423) TaxID=403673 RepID=A0A177W964_BATDL|nr:saccharopine dehydrogenase, variant 1 [Batrachochytrium dendrobatidis JEL423]
MTAIKNILLLGSGYVAPPCLNYLLRREENHVTVASRRIENVEALAADRPRVTPISLDVDSDKALEEAISKSDIVISLIPYTHHARVIAAAIKHKKHVVTTSYVSPAMLAHDQAAREAGVTIFNEIGVDPGIDHLYAIKTIDEVHQQGGKIVSFLSYCGGLPAPEASNNPLGYKFSWSSRGVLLALRNDAKYLQDGKVVEVNGPNLMDIAKPIYIFPAFAFEGYPNRDSTPYNERYAIPECKTLLRGTLRYQGFPMFIKALVTLGFLNDAHVDCLSAKSPEIKWNAVFAHALGTLDTSESNLTKLALAKTGLEGENARRVLHGLKWLGLFSDTLVTRKETLLDTLCATLEQKMQYEEGERDMVMLQHKFEIEWANGSKVRGCILMVI